MTAVAAFVLALVPLAIAPGLLFYFDVTPKAALVLVGAACALVVAGFRFSQRGPLRIFGFLLLAQAATLTASTLLSAEPWLSLIGTNWRRFGLITHVAVLLLAWLIATAGTRENVVALLRVMAATGIVAALYGVAQYFGWDPLLPSREYHVGEGEWTIVRPPSTLGRANYLATWLLHSVFAGGALWLAGAGRTLGLIAAATGVLAIVLSGTRAGILGLLAGALFAVALRRRVAWRTVALGALTVVLLAALYVSPVGLKLRARTRWYVEDPKGGARLWLFRDTLAMAAARPLFGYGPETYTAQFAPYQSVESARAYPDTYHESPHNIFLDALAAQGVPGALVLIAIAAFGLRLAWTLRTKEPALAVMLGSGVAAATASQQFTAFTLPNALYFYGSVALLAALAAGDRTISHPRHWLAGVPAVALTAVAVQWVIADRALEQARTALDSGRWREAAIQYERSRFWQPLGAGADLWFSRALAGAATKSSDLRERLEIERLAMNAAQRACATAEDRQNAHYNLASFYIARNNGARAEQSLWDAIRAAPVWFKPRWVLAQVLAAGGRLSEARLEAARAVELNAGKNAEVARTLAEIECRINKTANCSVPGTR